MEPVVLYEDPDVLAVDKPPGIVVIPAREEDPALALRQTLERLRGEALWVVHRLDRDTSGVVLFARSATAHRVLSLAFEHRNVAKTYLALTRGLPPRESGTIATALHPARRGKMRPAQRDEPGALPATTEYVVLKRWETPLGLVGLVEVHPRTGRQHQVRVHFRSIDAPLLVDPVYGRAERVTARELGIGGDEVCCGRLTLHALRVELPALAEIAGLAAPRSIEAPLASDLAAVVARLETPRADA